MAAALLGPPLPPAGPSAAQRGPTTPSPRNGKSSAFLEQDRSPPNTTELGSTSLPAEGNSAGPRPTGSSRTEESTLHPAVSAFTGSSSSASPLPESSDFLSGSPPRKSGQKDTYGGNAGGHVWSALTANAAIPWPAHSDPGSRPAKAASIDASEPRAGQPVSTGIEHYPPTAFPEPAAKAFSQEEPTIGHLLRLADEPGAEGLRLLAACWQVCAERGGALATVLEGLATALRAEEAQRQEVATQLAGPRATARMVALLPLMGLGLGAALGAHPLAFLLGTPPGWGCLVAGTALDLAGLLWTRRLARNAETLRG
ncbi:type II secretion system F family protein [Actinomadura sp. PM05-2]|uniref:Type II secretion system F family protein n=2 Tax=Actinomadura parmotrematis TaxID=2864039 RepID=A0ABS7FR79_9ACTN|nr:type II secretion system F family protein [Actinomadura parmotrematis]